jgi:high-affinity iron transporter
LPPTALQNQLVPPRRSTDARPALRIFRFTVMSIAGLLIAAILIWQGWSATGNPDPLAPHNDATVRILDIAVLVFREGLECVLVLAAVMANMGGARQKYQRPVIAGAGIAFVAALLTWRVAVGLIDDLTEKVSALVIQAATGLLAVLVLLVVMNWFFHKVYWTGWISMHTTKKRELLQHVENVGPSSARWWWGFGLLGFTSLYREGFEVVLFLQSYRLKVGARPVFYGVLGGLVCTGIVAVLTFIAHRRLPYRRMLVLTGILLGGVLLVMVGEQAQEMQLAHWLPTTELPRLTNLIPSWMGLWFSVFPTVETLAAQFLALLLVLGSYITARFELLRAGSQAR